MKILHIIPSLNMGGAEKFCVDLCNTLSKSHDVTICVLHKIKKESFLLQRLEKNVRIISLEKKIGLNLGLFRKINNFIKKEKPDVINTHLSGLFYSSIFCIRNNKIPIFHTVHNIAEKETSKFKRLIYNQLFKYNKVLPIGISEKIVTTIKDEYNLTNVPLIENGTSKISTTNYLDNVRLEINNLKINPAQKVFINIARISPQKNQKLLINAVSKFKNIILIIIGEITNENEKLFNELNTISDNVHFLGIKDNIGDYISCSDVFCLSSEYEGLPITLLEAMSLGKISISTRVGGIPDVIKDNINGFLTLDLSVSSYVEKINEIMNLDENKILSISENSKNTFLKNYSIKKTSDNYIKLYKQHRANNEQ